MSGACCASWKWQGTEIELKKPSEADVCIKETDRLSLCPLKYGTRILWQIHCSWKSTVSIALDCSLFRPPSVCQSKLNWQLILHVQRALFCSDMFVSEFSRHYLGSAAN